MTTAIVWFRRDLRVHDHPALHDARAAADRLGFLFVVEPRWLRAAPHRSAAFAHALDALDASLRARGASLTIRSGPAPKAVAAFARETRASLVVASDDVTPRARERDAKTARALEHGDARLHLTEGVLVHPPGSIVNASGAPYKIFSPFHRRWEERAPRERAPTPRRIDAIEAPSDPRAIRALANAREGFDPDLPTTEAAATAAARAFARRRSSETERHRLDGSGGSMLSVALRTGALSARGAAATLPAHTTRQIAWRDFASHAARAFPAILTRSLREPARTWSRDRRAFDEWCAGTTGEPVIDAAMRELRARGWISNRARMTVGSFLCRDLRIDWRDGARHFMHHLVDGDPAVNAFNWQWVAGTGYDAPAPFWRLAPDRQGERHDPDGSWRARWLPEEPG